MDWEMKQDRSAPGAGALYINGVQVRSWISADPNDFVIVTETGVQVKKGDIVQIAGKDDPGDSIYVQNAKMLCGNPTQVVEVK